MGCTRLARLVNKTVLDSRRRKCNLMLATRFNYLASDRDAWTNGLVDPTGNTGSHLGDMTEMRLRYDY